MPESVALIIIFGLFFLLLLAGQQISTVLLATGIVGVFLYGGSGALTGILQLEPYTRVASYALTTIPLFILMAEFIMYSDIVKYLYHMLFKVSKGKPGILGVFTILLGGFLGAVSGSASAISAALGQISVPELRKHGYNENLAGAVAASAGSLATLIPPSIGLIIYGAITQTPVGQLFMASVIPGILTIGVLVICTLFFYHRSKASVDPRVLTSSVREEAAAIEETAHAEEDIPTSKFVISLIASLFIMGSVFIGIYTGIFTPTEAGGVGAAISLIAAICLGKVNVAFIKNSLRSTVRITCMVMMIMIGAQVFAKFISLSMIPRKLIALLEPLAGTPILVIVLLLITYFILFMFVEGAAVLLMAVPVTLPIAQMIGLDAIEFGMLIGVVGAAGLLTPPVGMCVYAVAGVTKTPIDRLFRYSTIFAVMICVIVVPLLLIFPQLITWLPDTMSQ
ncbi:TRAP transporter large permease [Mesobacillus harenae]|uniref:TRAP transporter large permease n=1 Tax=Mesobacillus harenae TaxID=2213203 RepID=UPI0015803F9B|nr:TRAP transporter large permease subunit [Mesobacillus harenae]